MDLQLSAHIHAALHQHDLVLLDVEAGTYQCMPGAGEVIEVVSQGAGLVVRDEALAANLIGLRLATPGRPADMRPSALPPSRDLFDDALPIAGVADLAGMARASALMIKTYWGAPFGRLIATARARSGEGRMHLAEASREALVFRRMLPWAPWQGACLYRSFMLLRFMRRKRLAASWVFGVQTWPFEAHCWLQVGDLVLDDHVEHAASYSPIMVIGP